MEGIVCRTRRVLLPAMEKADRVSALLDIHRDALEGRPDGYSTVSLSGKPIAKILFVVGDVDNPYVEENLRFAEALRVTLEAKAPGVTRESRFFMKLSTVICIPKPFKSTSESITTTLSRRLWTRRPYSLRLLPRCCRRASCELTAQTGA